MTSRKRLAKLAKAKCYSEQLDIAEDSFPGTPFDGLFRDLSEAWMTLHEAEPNYEKAIRNPVMKKMAVDSKRRQAGLTKEQKKVMQDGDREDGEIYRQRLDEFLSGVSSDRKGWAKLESVVLSRVGACLADAVVKGESGLLREMADALDEWKRHEPTPDKMRAAIVSECHSARRLGKKFTMRELAKALRAFGVDTDNQDTTRTARRIAKEMGAPFQGTAGRPKAK